MTISQGALSLAGTTTSHPHPWAPGGSETEAARRSAQYHRCFPSMTVSLPATTLRHRAMARWVRTHDVAITIQTSDDLATAIAAGIHPRRLAVHADGVVPNELVSCTASLAVIDIVVDSLGQVAILDGAVTPGHRQAVLIHLLGDAAPGVADLLIAAATVSPRLHLTGLHTDVGSQETDFLSYPAAVGELICTMRRTVQVHRKVLTRLSLGGAPSPADARMYELTRQAALIDQSVHDAYVTADFPRPTVALSATADIDGRPA